MSEEKTEGLIERIYPRFRQSGGAPLNVVDRDPPSDSVLSSVRLIDIRIHVTFRVRVHFSEKATETMEDKILRIIRNSEAENASIYGIMDMPQMSRQSERSA